MKILLGVSVRSYWRLSWHVVSPDRRNMINLCFFFKKNRPMEKVQHTFQFNAEFMKYIKIPFIL